MKSVVPQRKPRVSRETVVQLDHAKLVELSQEIDHLIQRVSDLELEVAHLKGGTVR